MDLFAIIVGCKVLMFLCSYLAPYQIKFLLAVSYILLVMFNVAFGATSLFAISCRVRRSYSIKAESFLL